MSTITKPKTSIFAAIASLFSSGVDVEIDEGKLPKELDDVLRSLATKEREVEQAITGNISNNSKKGGFGKKINPNTEKAMRAMHKEVQKSVEDRERE